MSTVPMRPTERLLSQSECSAIARQALALAEGGGDTSLILTPSWAGNLRWARNTMLSSGDVQDTAIELTRMIRGARGIVTFNRFDTEALRGALRRAERLTHGVSEDIEAELRRYTVEPYTAPNLWFDRTFQLLASDRSAIVQRLMTPVREAGLLSAGYIEVSGHGRAFMENTGPDLYFPYTQAQYSVTVRDPEGTGSGWAGVTWNDWGHIDADVLSAKALDKCLRSRNPAVLEPGRYTAVLEPQAAGDLVTPLFEDFRWMDRDLNERPHYQAMPFMGDHFGVSKIGQRVIDSRLTISADPMDPDLGFPVVSDRMYYGESPYTRTVFHPATWFRHGVLTDLSYTRQYAMTQMLRDAGLRNSGAFRVDAEGPQTGVSVDEMIASTERGILVTRCWSVEVVEYGALVETGVTRDGTWLIERGKISKPVKNFRFSQSLLGMLNNIDAIGTPQRIFRTSAPAVVPALKVRDFNFVAMVDAI